MENKFWTELNIEAAETRRSHLESSSEGISAGQDRTHEEVHGDMIVDRGVDFRVGFMWPRDAPFWETMPL